MSTTTTSSVTTGGGTNALGVMFDRKVINSLQPNLYFESIATISMVGNGNYTDRFAMFDQIATSNVTSLTEATAPTGVAVTTTIASVTPTQYGISVEVSDLVVITTFFDLIVNTSIEVGYAMARSIDNTIQTTAEAGTNVYYAGGKAARASLGALDIFDINQILKAGQKLKKGAAPAFGDGYYRAVCSPDQIFDLKQNTAAGQFVDVSKYAQPENILNGEIGALHGTRIMESPNVQTFSSTVTVTPALFAGEGGVRVSYWLPSRVKNYINNPEDSNIANPIGQKGNVGSKVNMGVSRTQEARLVRVETSTSVAL